MNTMNTMMDTFHFDDVASSPQSSTRKQKHLNNDADYNYSDCVTPAPHDKTTRIFRQSSQQSPPPLRRMTDEDRMNLFAQSMDEEAFSFLSFPSLTSSISTSTSGGPRTPTPENQDQESTSCLLPSTSLAPRMRLAPSRCLALPSELELRRASSLLDDDDDSDDDNDADNDDLTPQPLLLQTCLSFDSDNDNDDAKNEYLDFARQRRRRAAQSPLQVLFHGDPYSSGPFTPMRKTPPTHNQLLLENLTQIKTEIELSIPQELKLHHCIHHHGPSSLKEPEQQQRMTYPAQAA